MANFIDPMRTEVELEMWASYTGPRIVMLTRTQFLSADEMHSYFWIAARMGLMVV